MKSAIFTAMDLAKYIIDFCYKNGCAVSTLKLQKMLYFLQVDHFKNEGELLFQEDICAWMYGPVVQNVYHRYSGYCGRSINNEYNIEDSDRYTFLNDKIKFLAEYDPWELVDLSHKENGPWDRVYKQGKGEGDVIDTSFFQYEEFEIPA